MKILRKLILYFYGNCDFVSKKNHFSKTSVNFMKMQIKKKTYSCILILEGAMAQRPYKQVQFQKKKKKKGFRGTGDWLFFRKQIFWKCKIFRRPGLQSTNPRFSYTGQILGQTKESVSFIQVRHVIKHKAYFIFLN